MSPAKISVPVSPEEMPSAEEVESLYIAASAPPPLSEPSEVGALYARLYAACLGAPGTTAVFDRGEDGALVGFSYAHPWSWGENTDPWSSLLRERLGAEHTLLEGAFALPLLAVRPDHGGRGLGVALLTTLVDAVPVDRMWLQTRDMDTPARRLYERQGWSRFGYGPDAPDGRPGLVMVRDRAGREAQRSIPLR